MKKINLLLLLFVSVVVVFSSCSSDDDPVYKRGVIEIPEPEGGYVVKIGELLTINPEIETEPGDRYEWNIEGKQVSNKRILEYTFEESGTYEVAFMVANDIHYYLNSAKVKVTVYSENEIIIPEPEGGYVVRAGELLTIDPETESESEDKYEWSIDGKQISDKRILEHTFEEIGAYEITLLVTNQVLNYWNSGKVTVKVLPNDLNYVRLDLSDFDLSDGIATAGGKYWSGTYDEEDAHVTSQIFRFSHTAMDWGGGMSSWDGFTVSNSTDNSEQADFVTNQFASMAKGGVKGESTPYMVAYAAEGMRHDSGDFSESRYTTWVQINDNENSYKAIGTYVSNHSWSYYCITKGNGIARKFAQGDYFILKAYGVDAENNISEPAEFCLADYRSANESEWTVNDKWEWMDLSSLGEVKYIFFKLETTDKNGNWSNTSLYFCLDNLTVEKID